MTHFSPTRREFLKNLGIASLGAMIAGCQSQIPYGENDNIRRRTNMNGKKNSRQPNIIIILADDMGYGDCGCYGSSSIKTPRLDSLASGGVRFTDFHSNGAVCSPTRASMLTGRYPQRCGVEDVILAASQRHVGLPVEEVTFAELLKGEGYKTALFGKWHLGYEPKFNPVRRGFDEFRGFVSGNVDYKSHIDQTGEVDWWKGDVLKPEEGYTTELVTEHGMRFIKENKDTPFCLYLAHECPHYPYQGPKDDAFRSPGHPEPKQGPRKDRAEAYKEMMASMDTGIGKIVDTVASLGLAEETFIFFFSDNGPCPPGSAGPFRGGKASVWEGGHRVPAIGYWPGVIPAGTETAETCLGMDLFPTLLSMSGVEIPPKLNLDGIDILPVMTGVGKNPDRTVFWRHHEQKAARRKNWKLVVRKENAAPELYDLSNDPGESQDIAASHPDIVVDLSKALSEWEQSFSKEEVPL